MKPHFTDAKGTMTYAVPGAAPTIEAPFEPAMKPLVGAHKDVRFARFKPISTAATPNLLAQKDRTKITVENGFPSAKAPKVLYYSMSDAADRTTLAGKRESQIWKICSLFLDLLPFAAPEIVHTVPQFQLSVLEEQMRMDALGAFWAKEILVEDVGASLKKASSAEEKALVLLTKNDVPGACDVLTASRNFKLAMLVSQLPGSGSSERSRALLRSQIEAWRSRNDWAEMSDAVRALYSICAGQVCNVEGKAGTAENRVDGFNICERFGWSWKQGFAMRLFYGGWHNAGEAIRAYGRDLTDGLESVIPSMSWDEGGAEGGVQMETADALIEVLMLLAGAADISKIFDSRVIAGSAWDTRLTWQLAGVFDSSGLCPVPREQLDRLTLAYAGEIEASGGGALGMAGWVLLHLSDEGARERAVRALLERNAEVVTHGDGRGEISAEAVLQQLTEELRIPAPLVHRVRALYAASNGDAAAQTLALILAGDVEEAHGVICTTVGPQAVIEQDFDALASLLTHFEGLDQKPENWSKGGQVYADFLRLVTGKRNASGLAQKLRKGLKGMEGSGQGKRSLEERVAVGEMRRVVQKAEAEGGEGEEVVVNGMGAGVGSGEGGRMLEAYWRGLGVVA